MLKRILAVIIVLLLCSCVTCVSALPPTTIKPSPTPRLTPTLEPTPTPTLEPTPTPTLEPTPTPTLEPTPTPTLEPTPTPTLEPTPTPTLEPTPTPTLSPFELGKRYYNEGKELLGGINPTKGIENLELAAGLGNVDAQYLLGKCYATGDAVIQDYTLAAKYFQMAANQGNAVAQFEMGYLYNNGLGVQQDDQMAFKYYQQAAEQGYIEAQVSLGTCYFNGNGVQKDVNKAAEYYQKAADQGNNIAQETMGYFYENGIGVPCDLDKAFLYYQLAADQGNAAAQNALGFFYEAGICVKQDWAIAAKYYQMAADQGLAAAQYNIACYYKNGLGIEENMDKAIEYFTLAANQGYEDAKKKLEEIQEKITYEAGIAHLINVQTGDVIELGSIREEPIPWVVLSTTELSGSKEITLLAQKYVAYKLYNTRYEKTSWENCSLRAWLNHTFIGYLNKPDVQIKETKIWTELSRTDDKAWILSVDEYKELPSIVKNQLVNEAMQNADNDLYYEEISNDGWLRDSGNTRSRAQYISVLSNNILDGEVDKSKGIRPVVTVVVNYP